MADGGKLAALGGIGFMLVMVGLNGRLGSMLGAIIDPGNMQEGQVSNPVIVNSGVAIPVSFNASTGTATTSGNSGSKASSSSSAAAGNGTTKAASNAPGTIYIKGTGIR